MANKLLVIAGTHQRENGLSHSVLNSIDYRLKTESQAKIDCETSSAVVTSYGDLVTARIILPSDDLRLSQYESKFHWTSVHKEILEQVDPVFFIDIHSWHVYGRDAGNTGAYIKPHSKESYAAEMKRLLKQAQSDKPLIYGSGEKEFPDEDKMRDDVKRRMMREQGLPGILKRLFSRDAQIKLYVDASRESIRRQWSNNWFILRNEEHNVTENFCGYSCFAIEGIDEDKCRDPITDFIVDYVLKDLSCFRRL